MNHALALSDYYRRESESEKAERLDAAVYQLASDRLDSFDAKDAAEAMDYAANVAKGEPDLLYDRFCEAMAGLTLIRYDQARPAIRAAIVAWQDLANDFANHEARKELTK